MIKTKRVYEKPSKEEGYRILADRLWPRGLSKEKAKVDLWLKDIAPSDKLRKWFSHDPKKWNVFKKRYMAELEKNKETLGKLKKIVREKKVVTLLYSAKDQNHNNIFALSEFLKSR